MPRRIKVAPSLLAADFSKLEQEIKSVEDAGADLLHVDVMDGHFVPNLTIGPFIVEAIKRVATIPLNVHLMIEDPAKFLHAFIEAGADSLAFHAEIAPEPHALISKIRKSGLQAGIAVSPETPLEAVSGLLDGIDHLLIMTVHPGFGGQALIPECVEKVRRVAKAAPDLDIEVDGGINHDTVSIVAAAGANMFVAGTAVFNQPDRAAAIAEIRRLAEAEQARRIEEKANRT